MVPFDLDQFDLQPDSLASKPSNDKNNEVEMVTEQPVAEATASTQLQANQQQIEVNKFFDSAKTKLPNALSLLAQYSGSDSDEDDASQVDDSVYRKPKSEPSSSSSSDSEEEKDIKVIEKKIREPVESDGDSDDEGANKKKKREPLKVKGELTIDDLPPIQDLKITVDERECMEIGVITTIVDQLGELKVRKIVKNS